MLRMDFRFRVFLESSDHEIYYTSTVQAVTKNLILTFCGDNYLETLSHSYLSPNVAVESCISSGSHLNAFLLHINICKQN